MSSMTIARKALQTVPDGWEEALRGACAMIAPVWPLDQWIAVNPFWGMKHLPVQWADAVLGHRGGFSMLMPAAFYREAWRGGRIRREDLQASLREHDLPDRPEDLVSWLERGAHRDAGFAATIMRTYPLNREGDSTLARVRDQVAGGCAAFFDQHQAGWSVAGGTDGLFRFWLESSRADLSLDTSTGIAGARKALAQVPDDTTEAARQAAETLGLGADALQALAHFWLLQVNGWASWCRGVDWRAGLENRTSDSLWELLAITLVWEQTGVRCASTTQKANWLARRHGAAAANPDTRGSRLWVWQRAYEIGYRRTLCRTLTEPAPASHTGTPDVQAVFCIDVRSEVMRRHLEDRCPQVQTLGFAGFFGLPVEHLAHGPSRPVRRLPGLLSAPFRWLDSAGSLAEDHHLSRQLNQREMARASVRGAKYGSLSTFTLVETTGLAWAWKLVKDSLGLKGDKASPGAMEGRLVHAIGGDPLTDREKAALVAGMLRGMSLTSGFAPLLAFVGHGSHTDNNPHHAGLECGACGGQAGATNARLAATLFNDPQVRAELAGLGIRVPDYTWAVAAEHCTLTDQVTLFDTDQVPQTHLSRLAELEEGFDEAGTAVRRERAAALGLTGLSDEQLKAKLAGRGRDWSEVRPEWGLANNAAIVFAQRSQTRGRNLGGRVFLHDYNATTDEDGSVLESLLTAPMVVANWINMQYFASVTAPEVYGAGNKLLHSVVGGNVGVIEGNSPQLRIGLPLQSVHDGKLWRHEPMRLTVVIDAPAERIEAVLQRQRDVAELVDNQWLFLMRLSGDGVEQYRDGHWERMATPARQTP